MTGLLKHFWRKRNNLHEFLCTQLTGYRTEYPGADRLMLTHLRPTLDPARSVEEAEATFGRPVELAVPGLMTDV